MPTEVEAKFLADGDGPLTALAAADTLGACRLESPRTVDEVDRYLDTEDGRLAAAGWACRLRTRAGVTRISLKGSASSADLQRWHHRRAEVEGPADATADPAAWPPSEARDLVITLSDGAPLGELVRLEQRRTERRVRGPSGERIGILSLDRVRMRSGDEVLGDLRVVELELELAGGAGERALPDLADALRRRPGLVPDPRTKLEHALARLAARTTG